MQAYYRWFNLGLVFGLGYYIGTSVAGFIVDGVLRLVLPWLS